MVSKADREAAAETLRANIKRLRATKKLTQRALGVAAGMDNPDTTISDFLSGRAKQLDYAYLKPMARALGCGLEDLFSDSTQESTGVPGPVTPVRLQSASTFPPGDVDGTQARLLEERDQLTKENAALRLALDGIADELKTLAAVVKPRKAQSAKPGARGRR